MTAALIDINSTFIFTFKKDKSKPNPKPVTELELIFLIECRSWGNGSVGKVFTEQAWVLEFDPQYPRLKKKKLIYWGNKVGSNWIPDVNH